MLCSQWPLPGNIVCSPRHQLMWRLTCHASQPSVRTASQVKSTKHGSLSVVWGFLYLVMHAFLTQSCHSAGHTYVLDIICDSILPTKAVCLQIHLSTEAYYPVFQPLPASSFLAISLCQPCRSQRIISCNSLQHEHLL